MVRHCRMHARRLTRGWQGAVRPGDNRTQDAGGVDAEAAAASDNDGAVRWESRAAGWCRRCPQEVAGLLDVVATICQKLRFQAVSMSSA